MPNMMKGVARRVVDRRMLPPVHRTLCRLLDLLFRSVRAVRAPYSLCDRSRHPAIFSGPTLGRDWRREYGGAICSVVSPIGLDGVLLSRQCLRETNSGSHAQTGPNCYHGNLGSHRGKAVRQAIREAGAKLLFLPKYSPDLNPIEQVFSKLKHGLRKAKVRSYDALLAAKPIPPRSVPTILRTADMEPFKINPL